MSPRGPSSHLRQRFPPPSPIHDRFFLRQATRAILRHAAKGNDGSRGSVSDRARGTRVVGLETKRKIRAELWPAIEAEDWLISATWPAVNVGAPNTFDGGNKRRTSGPVGSSPHQPSASAPLSTPTYCVPRRFTFWSRRASSSVPRVVASSWSCPTPTTRSKINRTEVSREPDYRLANSVLHRIVDCHLAPRFHPFSFTTATPPLRGPS